MGRLATYVAAGDPTPVTVPGDFVLTHGSSFINKGIRFVQAIQFQGKRRKFAYWNHIALISGTNGEIIEAHLRGVGRANLNVEYRMKDCLIVHVTADAPVDRDHALKFAESCLGNRYGFVTIIGLLMFMLFGGRLVIGLDGTEICSGLVGQALVRYGVIFKRNPAMLLPAEIAEFYNAAPPYAG